MLTITNGYIKGSKSTESQIKEVVKKAKKVATKKVVTPKIKDVKKPSKVATVQAKAVTLDQIKEVIKLGTMTLTTEKKMTDTIVADLFNMEDGIYLDSFNESDLGKYKAVKIRKVKNEDTLEESLMKWMRSQKLHDKDSDDYETETVRALLDNIDKGIV